MFRSSLHHIRPGAATFSAPVSVPARRLLSIGSNVPKRTWKGAALRWGAAAGAIYFYNTSPIFQDVPMPQTIPPPKQFDTSDNLTIDAVIEARRQQIKEEQAAKAAAKALEAEKKKAKATTQDPMLSNTTSDSLDENVNAPQPGSPAALQAEADQQGAFNPETGEINWDCPCLGGMAHGPCGDEFKVAFSCFVYSEEEPKGMDCIEKFQGMQTCFRAHPDVYGAELDDDEDSPAPGAPASEGADDVVGAAEPVAASEPVASSKPVSLEDEVAVALEDEVAVAAKTKGAKPKKANKTEKVEAKSA